MSKALFGKFSYGVGQDECLSLISQALKLAPHQASLHYIRGCALQVLHSYSGLHLLISSQKLHDDIPSALEAFKLAHACDEAHVPTCVSLATMEWKVC